jgi:hypothetical protein
MKRLMPVCGLAAVAIGCFVLKQVAANDDTTNGSSTGKISPAPVQYAENGHSPTCYWTRGWPTWDKEASVWVRPRIRVCD